MASRPSANSPAASRPLRPYGSTISTRSPLHHTDDPEVLIVELVASATVTTTGHALTARSIQVLRIRDGKIVLFRDYVDPNGLADALGA